MSLPFVPTGPVRPLIGVLCCNEVAERPIQAVATRFVEPLRRIAEASVLLVPAIADPLDAAALAGRLDGLLLTGSRSDVAAECYGGVARDGDRRDAARDQMAFALAGRMIEAGRPVFGICRGLQELNVLFGGTLARDLDAHHRDETGTDFAELFDHAHDVKLSDGGLLASATGTRQLTVNSVHRQGIDRLGHGLAVEAVASDDGLVEAIAARPCGGQLLAVQWHPEWDAAQRAGSRAFFRLVGAALRREALQLV